MGKGDFDPIRGKAGGGNQIHYKCATYSTHMDRKTKKGYIKMIKVVPAAG